MSSGHGGRRMTRNKQNIKNKLIGIIPISLFFSNKMYTCIHVYKYICIHLYQNTCIQSYMYTCIHVYMCGCILHVARLNSRLAISPEKWYTIHSETGVFQNFANSALTTPSPAARARSRACAVPYFSFFCSSVLAAPFWQLALTVVKYFSKRRLNFIKIYSFKHFLKILTTFIVVIKKIFLDVIRLKTIIDFLPKK